MREIVLDTETTGFNPHKGDRIVEIGCLELDNFVPTGAVYHVYINPRRPMPAEAEKVHGLSDAFLRDKPLFAEIAADFLDFAADSPLVIHNAPFDIGFLDAELERAGFPPLGLERAIDTLAMSRKKYPFAPNSLDALCRRFSIDLSGREKHGALLDCELLAQVYLELIGGHQPALHLDTGEPESQGQSSTGSKAGRRPRPLKPRLSEADIARHRAFVETLGDEALWKRLGG